MIEWKPLVKAIFIFFYPSPPERGGDPWGGRTIDEHGVEQTMGFCDYHHEKMRAAIEADPPGGASRNLRMCVNDPATPTPGACNMHPPTKIAFDESTPPGD
jgi:hypothetical protein